MRRRFWFNGGEFFLRTRPLWAAAVFLSATLARGVEPGETAPELRISEWVANGPVVLRDGEEKDASEGRSSESEDGADGRRIQVVEFWATWCPPCLESMPVLSRLAAKHADDGLVVVSVTREKADVVKPFLEKHGENLNYHVALDEDGRTTLAYLGRDLSIPKAFVVENGEKVLWKGHPMDLGRVLAKVFDGTFDLDSQRRLSALRQRMQSAMREADEEELVETSTALLGLDPLDTLALRTRMYVFESKNQYAEAVAFLDELIEEAPSESSLHLMKLKMLAKSDLGPEVIRRHAEAMERCFENDPLALSRLTWGLLDWLAFGDAPLDVALSAARKAVAACGEDADLEREATCLAVLARAYYATGRLEEAIETQSASAELAEDRKRALVLLNFYRQAKRLRTRRGSSSSRED